MDLYPVWLLLVGLACFGAAWLPHVLKGKALSYPALYVGCGALIFAAPFGLDMGSPVVHADVVERLTEILVILALMGAGLKLGRPVGWKSWGSTWRLLGITMPLCIAGLALGSWWFAGLAPAAALLVAASLAPTDPVLASEVQAPPPGEKDKSDIRFALTSESGLNDGLAFPFVHLAIAAALLVAEEGPDRSLGQTLLAWFGYAVVYKIAAGLVAGLAAGYAAAWLIFRGGKRQSIADFGDGLAAIALTLIVYGATELVHGYGFLAVFVASVTLRQFERRHEYHRQLHEATELVERLMTATALVLFGGLLAEGLLRALTWQAAVVGLAFVLLVRPATGMLGLLGSDLNLRERLATSFFGIRGVGSFYYLAYGVERAKFPHAAEIWSLVAFTALCSIVVHGIAAAPGMRWADPKSEQEGESPD